MRKKLALIAVGIISVGGVLFLANSSSQAAGTKVDLSIAGGTVAGFTSAQAGQELPVSFTMTNRSTTTSAQVDFHFFLTNATADKSDYTCPLISNHFNIFADVPSCEPGTLAHGQHTSAAIMVTPTANTGTVTVRACAENLNNYVDPVSSNNCKTISIPIK
jgi:hypothetical protein